MSMKNDNDIIGNRTRDLPVCSAVPQPTALPRAPRHRWEIFKQQITNVKQGGCVGLYYYCKLWTHTDSWIYSYVQRAPKMYGETSSASTSHEHGEESYVNTSSEMIGFCVELEDFNRNFTYNRHNTRTVHVYNFTTVLYLLLTKSQFTTNDQNILHFEPMHARADCGSRCRWGCEFFNSVTNALLKSLFILNRNWMHVHLGFCPKGWVQHLTGLYHQNCLKTYIHMNIFLVSVWGTQFWNNSNNFTYILYNAKLYMRIVYIEPL
jgi:hypothetical protein